MRFGDQEIDNETRALETVASCRSNDPHVIALAQISGARFLCSDNQALQQDFKDRTLIGNPGGTVYSTAKSSNFSSTHWRLLHRKNICKI